MTTPLRDEIIKYNKIPEKLSTIYNDENPKQIYCNT